MATKYDKTFLYHDNYMTVIVEYFITCDYTRIDAYWNSFTNPEDAINAFRICIRRPNCVYRLEKNVRSIVDILNPKE